MIVNTLIILDNNIRVFFSIILIIFLYKNWKCLFFLFFFISLLWFYLKPHRQARFSVKDKTVLYYLIRNSSNIIANIALWCRSNTMSQRAVTNISLEQFVPHKHKAKFDFHMIFFFIIYCILFIFFCIKTGYIIKLL